MKKEDGMRINVSAPVDKEILFKTAEEGNIKSIQEPIWTRGMMKVMILFTMPPFPMTGIRWNILWSVAPSLL